VGNTSLMLEVNVCVSNLFLCSLFIAKVVAKWDFLVHKVLLDICVEEVRSNNRPLPKIFRICKPYEKVY
jgi:hypothetical protein